MMRIFVSWSGQASNLAAQALRDWLPSVLQSVEVYVSSEDIAKGDRWGTSIGKQLQGSRFGILCVTAENANSAWLNFEAGALSREFESARVSPLLLGLEPTDLVGPLAQFQATKLNREDIEKLLNSIDEVSDLPLGPTRLRLALDVWWPKLEAQLHNMLQNVAPPRDLPDHRGTRDMVKELLESVRDMQRRLIADADTEEERPGDGFWNEFDEASQAVDYIAGAFRWEAGPQLIIYADRPMSVTQYRVLNGVAGRYGRSIAMRPAGVIAEWPGVQRLGEPTS